jgi:gliding motility-associated-like protein
MFFFKQYLFFLLLICCGLASSAQKMKSYSDKSYGGIRNDRLSTMIRTYDGKLLLGGISASPKCISSVNCEKSHDNYNDIHGQISTDFWILKVDTQYHSNPQNRFSKIWDKVYGGNDYDSLTCMIQSPKDTCYILGGVSKSASSYDHSASNQGGFDYWIIKTDQNGQIRWEKSYGSSRNDYLSDILVFDDATLLLCGYSNSPASGHKTENASQTPYGYYVSDYWIIKCDADGNRLWDKTFRGDTTDILTCALLLQNQDVLLCGYSYSDSINSSVFDKSDSSRGRSDFWVIRIDSSGNKIWDRSFGGNSNDELHAARVLIDGTILLGGKSESGISGEKTQNNHSILSDYWVINIDASGNVNWDKRYGTSLSEELYSISQSCNGEIYLGGYSTGTDDGDRTEPKRGKMDYWLLAVDEQGVLHWDKRFGGSGYQHIKSMEVYDNPNNIMQIYLGGLSSSNIFGDKSEANRGIGYDYWLFRIAHPQYVDFSYNFACEGDSVFFDGFSNFDAFSYAWDFNDPSSGASNYANMEDPVHIYQNWGVYFVKFRATNRCYADSVYKPVPVKTYPVFDLGSDTSLCENDSVLLDIGLNNMSYHWLPGAESSRSIYSKAPGVYTAIADNGSCSYSDSLEIRHLPLPYPHTGKDTLLCPDESIQITAKYYPGATYQWLHNGDTAHTIHVNSPGLYIIAITDSNNCFAQDSNKIDYADFSMLNLGNDTAICEKETLILDAGPGAAEYYWYPTGDTSRTLAVSQSGLYVVKLSIDRCSRSDSIGVTVNPLPFIDLGKDQVNCGTDTLILDAGQGFLHYLWSNGSIASSIEVHQSGMYSVSVSDSNLCSNSDTIALVFLPPIYPSIDTSAGTKFCGDSAIITLSETYDSYLWSTASTDPSIIIYSSGYYYATITDTNGCKEKTDSVLFHIYPLPEPELDKKGEIRICEDDSMTLSVKQNYSSYEWNTGSVQKSIIAGKTGIYYSTVTDIHGCTANTDTLFLIRIPNPVKRSALGDFYVFCRDSGAITLDAGYQKGASYLWHPDADTTQSISIKQAGLFVVEIKIGVCAGKDSVEVIEKCHPLVFIPNAFSPNNDGVNDLFFPTSIYADSLQLIIFNLWGEILYRDHGIDDEQISWDGTFREETVPAGLYFYILKYSNSIYGHFTRSGNIYLLR